MLRLQNIQEGLSELSLGTFALPWYRNGLVCAGSGVVLNQVFEIVVVNVVYLASQFNALVKLL